MPSEVHLLRPHDVGAAAKYILDNARQRFQVLCHASHLCRPLPVGFACAVAMVEIE
eukprot:CAMPEP_0180694662 /NCGR_PEP_ID=MMETSP1038_2-20121128/2032_1 /TAXON_ID=632150 /ORGANISM="Azadinium spinosum, Strain 3D9" /LENGTH=55 /DNA_ID=CAMNT_0022726023 /DNA_START=400 /DNA_END=567 /DNA_ORIENTATION=+